MGSPTTVTFIGPHFENAGKGIDATGGTGAQTTLNVIGGSCPITGTTMGPNATGSYSDVSYCAFFESAAMGGHIENLFGGLATTYTLEDDNFTPSYQTKDKFIELYDFGSDNGSGMRTRHCSEPSCMNQVPSLAIYGSGGTAAISTTGTNQPLVLSPPGTGFVEINNAGTAATPSFVFTDTTTGFYKSGTNTWGWSANGIGEFIFAGQGIRLSNSTVYQMSPSYNTAADTGMSRCTTTTGSASAGTVCIGSGSPQSATGILHSGMTSALTSATTISSTSFVTTNIVLPALPISMVQGFECDVIFKQAATLTSDLFAIGASNTPTAIWVMAQPFNSTYAAPKYTTITSSTITPIVLPLMPGAPGADYDLHISGALSTTSSNPVQLTLYAQISSGGGALTIEAGSQCHYTP